MSKFTAQSLLHKAPIFSSLIEAFRAVPDKRCDQGKRFELAYILGLVLLGFIKGKTSIESCVLFGTARKRWFSRWVDVTHGVPNATTVSRALAVTLPQDLIKSVNRFIDSIDGMVIEAGISLDGKTIRAISELKDGCKHFLSLFSHNTCRILDQEGITRKENEITATPRLLSRQILLGSMVTADALLTQTRITKAIRKTGADYLLVVKDNHCDLKDVLKPTFSDPFSRKVAGTFHETRKTRFVKTTITLTHDLDLKELRHLGWQDVALVGKLERRGTRVSKRKTTTVDETIYLITSRATLTPKAAYQFLRDHWHIENKLHWQKDVTWKEDRQRTRIGNAQNILSYLRSLALQCIKQKYDSVTKAIEIFTERPNAYLDLLTQLQIV